MERAVNVVHESQVRETNWFDLVREAEAEFKRFNGKPYSSSWHNNVKAAITACPQQNPLTLTPQLLNAWIRDQQSIGVAPLTISARCSALSGLITSCIKSGYLVGHQNPFNLITYSTKVVKHHRTCKEEEYKSWFSNRNSAGIPDSQVLYIDLLVYTGARVKEINILKRSDVDWDNGTIRIGVKLRNENHKRVIPIPTHLLDRLKAHDFKWVSNTTINKRIKTACPVEDGEDLVSAHSFRHGLKRLTRNHHIDSRLAEFFLGHALPKMEETYGDGFSAQSMREAMGSVWEYLDKMKEAEAPN